VCMLDSSVCARVVKISQLYRKKQQHGDLCSVCFMDVPHYKKMNIDHKRSVINLIAQKVFWQFINITLLDHLRDNGAGDGHLYLTK